MIAMTDDNYIDNPLSKSRINIDVHTYFNLFTVISGEDKNSDPTSVTCMDIRCFNAI